MISLYPPTHSSRTVGQLDIHPYTVMSALGCLSESCLVYEALFCGTFIAGERRLNLQLADLMRAPNHIFSIVVKINCSAAQTNGIGQLSTRCSYFRLNGGRDFSDLKLR